MRRVQKQPAPPDPVVEAYRRDVDLSLIRENLRRTPEERVRNLEQLQRFAEELRKGGRRSRDPRR